tara:strand:- start:7 stop:921 length:915 start_codon:yes stop_codon:yes gene_type:complete
MLVCSYNIVAIYIFGKTLISAAIKKRKDKLSNSNSNTATNVVVNNANTQITQITPVQGEIKITEEEEEAQQSQQSPRFNDFSLLTTENTLLERQRTKRIVDNIHKEHRQSQIDLDASIEMKGRKQRRRTELRLKTRAKLKKQKVLSEIPAFSKLNEAEIDAMIGVMVPERHLIGTELCKQGDVALKFYVVMSGECNAYEEIDGKTRILGSIKTFQFFGEHAILSEPTSVNKKRNATVEVISEFCSLLVLTRSKFYNLIEENKLRRNVLDGVKKVDLQRQEQNLVDGSGNSSRENNDIESRGVDL